MDKRPHKPVAVATPSRHLGDYDKPERCMLGYPSTDERDQLRCKKRRGKAKQDAIPPLPEWRQI